MSGPHGELAERIRGELADLGAAVGRSLHAWEQAPKSGSGPDAYLDSVALNLHSFYTGLERLFELIARHIDCDLPSGDNWHRQLLDRMATDVHDVRPAVISADVSRRLDEIRRFRHVVRNVYAFNLAPERMAGLMVSLSELWAGLRDDLSAFADYLARVAEALAAEGAAPQ